MPQIQFRLFEHSDALSLRQVYESAVSQLTVGEYNLAQRTAWIQASADPKYWLRVLERIQPSVTLVDGKVAGYFDLQPDGLIDHFYVVASFAHQGVARAMMDEILQRAKLRDLSEIHAYVSLTAQPFFTRYGFEVVYRQNVEVGGQQLENARMCKRF
ncbi:GNAT family N-acetyltransferase [Hafnia alvei]|uniref:GNAT family N-acetyltransferase n=1 Tax=Hafnia alvei TaxID=569 RepID=UPI0014132D78|nr:GNAT family N-acetyltransferase [Hafnia alvei]QIP57057.1 GNAT family N-acetyltransferase [Hafnia alvei]